MSPLAKKRLLNLRNNKEGENYKDKSKLAKFEKQYLNVIWTSPSLSLMQYTPHKGVHALRGYFGSL